MKRSSTGLASPLFDRWYWFAILVVLGLLFAHQFPRAPRGPSPDTRAKNDANTVALAIISYHNEYGHYPNVPFPSEVDPIRETNTALTAALREQGELNPRGIAFYDPKPAPNGVAGLLDGSVVDSWGNRFVVIMDANHDRQIQNPDPTDRALHPVLHKGIIVYSSGPDGDASTWSDNVTTWR